MASDPAGRDWHPSMESHPEQAFCLCGSAWFFAPIAIQHDGEVNGYGGPLVCVDCGNEYPVSWRGAVNIDGSWYDPSKDDDK